MKNVITFMAQDDSPLDPGYENVHYREKAERMIKNEWERILKLIGAIVEPDTNVKVLKVRILENSDNGANETERAETGKSFQR